MGVWQFMADYGNSFQKICCTHYSSSFPLNKKKLMRNMKSMAGRSNGIKRRQKKLTVHLWGGGKHYCLEVLGEANHRHHHHHE